MVVFINGKALAKLIVDNFYIDFMPIISSIAKSSYKPPHLVIYHLNTSKASQIYIKQKIKLAEKLNIQVSVKHFDASTNEANVIESIYSENKNSNISSVVVQLPIDPKFHSVSKILNSVDPIKDVDSLTLCNKERLLNGELNFGYIPPTVYGVISLIASQQSVTGNKIGVIGQGPTLGQPCSLVLGHLANIIVDIDDKTPNIAQLCSTCDILIGASGKVNHITSDLIKVNCGIIDGGAYDEINNISNSSVCLTDAEKKAAWISPSPGGLGPLTVVWLFYNVYLSYLRQNGYQTPSFETTYNKIKYILGRY